MFLVKHPAPQAREGPARPIKVTEQGKEGRSGDRGTEGFQEVEIYSQLWAQRSEHQFAAPRPPWHTQSQENLAPGARLLGADGEAGTGRRRDRSKVTQEAEAEGRTTDPSRRPPALLSQEPREGDLGAHPALSPSRERTSSRPLPAAP